MYLIVEDNPNCAGDERMFGEFGPAREVAAVCLDRPDGTTGWCDVVAVDGPDTRSTPTARQVEDSAAGVAWLVRGGAWGLRLKPQGSESPWSPGDPAQWGVPFLVLDDSPEVIRFR